MSTSWLYMMYEAFVYQRGVHARVAPFPIVNLITVIWFTENIECVISVSNAVIRLRIILNIVEIFPLILNLLSLCWNLYWNIYDQMATHTRKVISRVMRFIYYCIHQTNADCHPNKQGVDFSNASAKCADSCLLSIYYYFFSLIFLISSMKLHIISSLSSRELQTLWNQFR
jgi:hypothetical protein